VSRRYRRGGPMYWWYGLLLFRYPGTIMVAFLLLWLLAKCTGH
jgi:hypothetical protein